MLALVVGLGCAVDRSGLAGVDAGTGGVDAPGVDAPGVDAPGVDAPPMDAPPMDAPPMDAPPMDAPGIDAGIDAGTDAGIDAGTDAGTDAGIDAGVPEDWWDTDWGCRRRVTVEGGRGDDLNDFPVLLGLSAARRVAIVPSAAHAPPLPRREWDLLSLFRDQLDLFGRKYKV